MKPFQEFESYSVFADDSDTISLVSSHLTSASMKSGGIASRAVPETAPDAQKMSELQSLLLMARLMLGDKGATAA